MRKFIFILLIQYFGLYLFAQNNYFSDTIHFADGRASAGMSLVPKQNGDYALLTYYNIDSQIDITQVSPNGNSLGRNTWIIDTTKYFVISCSYFTQLPSGNLLLPAWQQTKGMVDNYACLLKMNSNLEDTLQTKVFKFNYQDTLRNSYLNAIATDETDQSIWVVGGGDINISLSYTMVLTRMDTLFNTISENWITNGTKRFIPEKVLGRKNHTCIVAGITGIQAGEGWDDIRICKVSDNGVVWSKNYGNSHKIDLRPQLFKGNTDSTFWLIYTEGRTDTISTSGSNIATRLRAVLLTDSGVELMSKYLVQPMQTFIKQKIALPLADGGYLFGFLYRSNKAIFQKYDANFNLVWQSIPYAIESSVLDGDYINPLHAAELPNGDFICTGEYSNNIPTTIWLGKMDSTGCWYDTGCSVATESGNEEDKMNIKIFPNPAKDYITIQFSKPIAQGNIKIYTTEGKQVFETKISDYSLTIPVMEWANGVYTYILAGNDYLHNGKIIILK